MIPIKLKIKGLYSFKEEQVIDFERLLDAHLFGIFGKVGSGKSSILEAISFVLYGQSERLNKADKRNFNMMNLKSNEMNIEFIFKAGQKSISYKATAYAKRNPKDYYDVKKVERKLYRQEEGEWLPISVEEISDIMGLSYNNFKRAIIIPQGKFQEFLGLKNTERSEMLREIFNLKKFDLYHKVAVLASRNNEAISNITGQLEQLKEVSVERLKEQKSELVKLKKVHKSSENEFAIQLKHLQESEKIKNLFEELESTKNDLHSYVEKYETKVLQIEAEAKSVAYCNEFFKAGLEQLEQQKKDISEIENEIRIQNDKLQVVDKQLVVQKKKLVEIKSKNDKKVFFQDVIHDIEKGAERLSYLKDKKPLDLEWAQLSKEAQKYQQLVERLEKEEKENKSQLRKLEKDAPDLIELIKIRDWYEKDKDIDNSIKEQQHELESVDKALATLADKIAKTIKPFITFLPKIKSLSTSDALKAIQKTTLDFTEKIKQLSESERNMITKNALANHANALQDGAPCPVCGSMEHPNVLNGDKVAKQLDQIQIQLKEFQNKKEVAQAVLMELLSLESLESNNDSRKKLIVKKLTNLEDIRAKHQKTKFWKDKSVDSLGAILQKVGQAEQIKEKMDSLSKRIKTLEQPLIEGETKLKKLLPQIDAIDKQRDQLQSKVDLLKEQIMPKVFERIQDCSLKEMESLKLKYQSQIEENALAFNEIEKGLKELEERKNTIITTLKLKNKSLEKEQLVFKKINKKINLQVTKSSFSRLDDVIALLAKRIDPKRQLERVDKYKKEVFSKEQKLEELIRKTSKVKFDSSAFDQLKLAIKEQENNLKDLVGQMAQSKSTITDLTQRVENKKVLNKELKILELRAGNIKTLSQLFKSQGFVNFISSIYLQNIVSAANHRFETLTKHQLSLELEVDNRFMVRDHLNGGHKRSIKTLSGGQTFQAALCLALALADNIHEITKSKKNFFFLDEGFGSQDNESIAAVFKTLKALRKENRTVGIISHVDSLQQEIDVHLTVKLESEEKGSVIHKSW